MRADHPHDDPADGRTECDVCGKFVWPVIHSCKGVPVTAAAWKRWHDRRRNLTEPSREERARYAAWLDRHRGNLAAAWYAAEALARAYDRAAVVTSADGDPALPLVLRQEIDDLYSRWEAVRWAGHRNF